LLVSFEVLDTITVKRVIGATLRSFCNTERLNIKTNDALVAFNGVVHEHGNVKMVVDHDLVLTPAGHREYSDWNAFEVIWRQVTIVLITDNSG